MGTSHIVGIAIAVIFGGVVVAAVAVTAYDRFKPVEKRIASLRKKLHGSATSTGYANISMVGLSEEKIKEIADQEGFDWTGYRGQNNEAMTFQRRISPGEGGGA